MSRFVLSLLLILVASVAPAHHSVSARYDVARRIVVEGVVTGFNFTNPHSLIQIDAETGSEGENERWVVQWLSTMVMARRGYGPNTLRAGDRIIATGNPTRDGSRWLRLLHLQRPSDGFEYEASVEEEYLLIPGQ